MLIVHVQVQVKPENVQNFIKATALNALASRKEPGVASFEVLQDEESPAKFLLIETYKTAAASIEHKNTAHYAAWRDKVAPMMAAPRQSAKYRNLFP